MQYVVSCFHSHACSKLDSFTDIHDFATHLLRLYIHFTLDVVQLMTSHYKQSLMSVEQIKFLLHAFLIKYGMYNTT